MMFFGSKISIAEHPISIKASIDAVLIDLEYVFTRYGILILSIDRKIKRYLKIEIYISIIKFIKKSKDITLVDLF